MRECKWFREGDCWIDCPDSVYPCICNGNLDECPMVDLNGRPLKDSDYCVKEEEVISESVPPQHQSLLDEICARKLKEFENALDEVCKSVINRYKEQNNNG